jgi:hypothetical protein
LKALKRHGRTKARRWDSARVWTLPAEVVRGHNASHGRRFDREIGADNRREHSEVEGKAPERNLRVTPRGTVDGSIAAACGNTGGARLEGEPNAPRRPTTHELRCASPRQRSRADRRESVCAPPVAPEPSQGAARTANTVVGLEPSRCKSSEGSGRKPRAGRARGSTRPGSAPATRQGRGAAGSLRGTSGGAAGTPAAWCGDRTRRRQSPRGTRSPGALTQRRDHRTPAESKALRSTIGVLARATAGATVQRREGSDAGNRGRLRRRDNSLKGEPWTRQRGETNARSRQRRKPSRACETLRTERSAERELRVCVDSAGPRREEGETNPREGAPVERPGQTTGARTPEWRRRALEVSSPVKR